MIELETVTRKWGNSLGITLPKEVVEQEHISENEHLRVLILKQRNPLKSTFGMMKGKWNKSGQEIKDELRRELHGIG